MAIIICPDPWRALKVIMPPEPLMPSPTLVTHLACLPARAVAEDEAKVEPAAFPPDVDTDSKKIGDYPFVTVDELHNSHT